ncbi:hypothetical protein KCU66_g47, partial [Aureobasidium melanogenum]
MPSISLCCFHVHSQNAFQLLFLVSPRPINAALTALRHGLGFRAAWTKIFISSYCLIKSFTIASTLTIRFCDFRSASSNAPRSLERHNRRLVKRWFSFLFAARSSFACPIVSCSNAIHFPLLRRLCFEASACSEPDCTSTSFTSSSSRAISSFMIVVFHRFRLLTPRSGAETLEAQSLT